MSNILRGLAGAALLAAESLATSDLRLVEAGNLRLELTEPVDLALGHENGRLRGVVQGALKPPAALLELTRDWTMLQNLQPR